MKFFVLVPCRGRAHLLSRCVDSVLAQDDPDFSLTIADDASKDGAVSAVLDDAEERGCRVIRRGRNYGATQNIVRTIRDLETSETIDRDDVFLIVDGDDALAHDGVLTLLRRVYAGDTLFSYGSYMTAAPSDSCEPARPLPADILTYGMIRAFTRDHGWWCNHPMSFRRRLFDVLSDDDWTFDDGQPHRHGYDITLGVPMIEAAGDRVAFVADILYVYSDDLPESVMNRWGDQTRAENQHTLTRPRRYQPLVIDHEAEEADREAERLRIEAEQAG